MAVKLEVNVFNDLLWFLGIKNKC